MSQTPKIAVIGIGNLLMRDEGVGVHVVQHLQKEYCFKPQIQLVDGGTTGMDLLSYFEENDRIILIDAVNFDQQPGYVDVLENDDILHYLTTKLSLHQLGIKDLLSYLKMMDTYPEQLVLVGIQPLKIEAGMELSDVIQSKLPRLLKSIFFILNRWDVQIKHLHEGPC